MLQLHEPLQLHGHSHSGTRRRGRAPSTCGLAQPHRPGATSCSATAGTNPSDRRREGRDGNGRRWGHGWPAGRARRQGVGVIRVIWPATGAAVGRHRRFRTEKAATGDGRREHCRHARAPSRPMPRRTAERAALAARSAWVLRLSSTLLQTSHIGCQPTAMTRLHAVCLFETPISGSLDAHLRWTCVHGSHARFCKKRGKRKLVAVP